MTSNADLRARVAALMLEAAEVRGAGLGAVLRDHAEVVAAGRCGADPLCCARTAAFPFVSRVARETFDGRHQWLATVYAALEENA
jgi:hypothetical protein